MTCPLKFLIIWYHAHIWRMGRGKLRYRLCIRCTQFSSVKIYTQLRRSLLRTRQTIA